MKTHTKVQFDIVIEQIGVQRLTGILDQQAGISGYTILPVQGGKGAHGPWTRNGNISDADGMAMVICIVDPAAKDTVLEKVYAFLEQRVGLLSFHEVNVVRDDRFK